MSKKQNRSLSDENPLERFQGLFHFQWRELQHLRQRVLKKSNPGDIHDLRIVLRRFRVALKLIELFSAGKVGKKFKKNLRKMQKNLGSIRNIDEALLFFQSRPDVNRTQLSGMLVKLRAIEWRRIRKLLRRFDRQFDKLVENMIANLRIISFKEKNYTAMIKYFSKRHNKLSLVAKQRKPTHALRIAIRKWRYLLEMIAVVLNRDYHIQLKLLKEYQTVLGKINDIATFSTLCCDMKLPSSDLKLVELCLAKEEKILLRRFLKLIKQKSLARIHYTLV